MAETEMVERVARAICQAIVEKDSAEAHFAYDGLAHDGGHPHAKLDIDIDREIEEAWPEFVHAAREAIRMATEPFVRIRDWNHDEAWQARRAYEGAVSAIETALDGPAVIIDMSDAEKSNG